MDKTFKLYLKAGEKLYLNGAVIRVDRRTSIELLNDATFLLENYVMQREHVQTQIDALYFGTQTLLLQSGNLPPAIFQGLMQGAITTHSDNASLAIFAQIDTLVRNERYFEALKTLRPLTSLVSVNQIQEAGARIA